MRRLMLVCAVLACLGCQERASQDSYVFVWAGDSASTASDFLGVIDANPESAGYGTIVASIATGTVGAHPHHTEALMPTNGHLLANGFHAGQTWLFDLTTPREPQILTSFGDVAGYSHPHTFVRLADGNVLATFQYAATATSATTHTHGSAPAVVDQRTGGLVEMDERGTMIRSASAVDPTNPTARVFPYSVLPLPMFDRAVSTSTNMDHNDTVSTAEWVQFWRLSDLTLLKSIALTPGPRGDEHHYTGEPMLLPDGKSAYIHTFNCGLYLVRDIGSDAPQATFVKGFPGIDCGVPVLTGNYWLQPVPETHSVVALDISDPEHPREVSSVSFGNDESPHWLSIDAAGRRLVLNSGGGSKSTRLYIINFDPGNGTLAIDERFRDTGSARPGVNLSNRTWPHGFTGTAVPHGSVFSRK